MKMVFWFNFVFLEAALPKALFMFLGPQGLYERCCAWVRECVGAWSIFETRSVQLLHKLLGESIIPADLLRPCRHFFLQFSIMGVHKFCCLFGKIKYYIYVFAGSSIIGKKNQLASMLYQVTYVLPMIVNFLRALQVISRVKVLFVQVDTFLGT